MGKVILRIVVILLVAGAVAGGIYLWGSNSQSAAIFEGGPGGHSFTESGQQFTAPDGDSFPAFSADHPLPGSGDFDRGGRGGGHDEVNLGAGLAGVGKNLGVVALVTLGVLLAQLGIRRILLWRKRTAAI